ncbi:HNH endonuclease [Microbacterium binotii]|uniref:HNH endonuclease n=1 Tax=Microbacterium binotii TaxID=462710 RepID=UPI0031DC718F
MLGAGGHKYFAHRVAFERSVRALLSGELVRHRCDNPPCVNPDHLEAGSHADNAADKMRRGRFTKLTGRSNGNARLDPSKVSEIRKLATAGLSRQAIADRFAISKATVSQIVTRRTWKEVP